MRRILSLWLGNWSTDRLHRRRRYEAPLVTVVTVGNRRMVTAADETAALAGLGRGMTLADARARIPDVAAVEADPAGDAAALAALADWCTRFSPWTAVSGEDGVWLDITGAVPLFPSEAALAGDLLDRLRSQGFNARAAIADTPGCAWAMARHAATGGPAIVVPPGGARAALAPLPVEALRLSPEIIHDLRRLGFRRIEALYGLPRAPLTPRFGEIVARRLDQAMGMVEEPISPRNPVEPRVERRAFAEPIGAADDLHRATAWLIGRMCRRLERDGMGVRRLELACYRVDAQVERVAIGTSRPNRDACHLTKLLAPHIEEIDPGLGIELMMVRVLEVDGLALGQAEMRLEKLSPTPESPLRLWGRGLGEVGDGLTAPSGIESIAGTNLTPPKSGEGVNRDRDAATALLIDRLANRLGAPNVLRLAARDSHVPERAMRLVPAFEPVPDGEWPIDKPRPIRLLRYPDPVEVMAPVPDDPPMQFRWHRILHRVRRSEGPERIGAEWWRQIGKPAEAIDDEIRDYYRVEDEAGRRYWLYRHGLYRPETTPRWFLHGFFA